MPVETSHLLLIIGALLMLLVLQAPNVLLWPLPRRSGIEFAEVSPA